MERILKWKQERAKLIKEARDLVDLVEQEKRDLSPEEEARYQKIFDDSAKLKGKIEREEALLDEERNMARVSDEPVKPNVAGNDPEARKKELHNAAFRSFLLTGRIPEEYRALQADSDPAGGFLVAPEEFVGELIKEIDDKVFIRQMARKFTLTTSDSLGVPALEGDVDDADWTTEIQEVTDDTGLLLGKRALQPHMLSKMVPVSIKLLRVGAISAEQLVRERLSVKFGITMEKAYLLGDGNNQPLGVFQASDDGIPVARDVSTGNTETAISADNLKHVKYALKEGYRRGANWIFHRDAINMISRLKDGEGQYLWRPGITEGDPDKILNIPVYESEFVPNTFTSGSYVGILGNFQYYWIADMFGMEIQRLVELLAKTHQVGFIGRAWSDGMPVLANAFARVKLA